MGTNPFTDPGFLLKGNLRIRDIQELEPLMPLPLSVPELCYLYRFFAGVGNALSTRMRDGSTPSEENLTFLLCELMDENTTARHVLDYPLSKLNADLDACGMANRVEVSFRTNEHNRAFEGAVSFADLGIVYERRDALGADFKKALLIQSKRLYSKNNEFRLDSAYEGFDHDQFKNLQALVGGLKESDAAYYFLYNPDSQGIVESDRKRLNAYESALLGEWRLPSPSWRRHRKHFGTWDLDLPAGPADSLSMEMLDRLRASQLEALATLPGLRVCGLRGMGMVSKLKKFPRLREFYEVGFRHPLPPLGPLFETFADFMVTGLVGCNCGSQDASLISIADGNKPSAVARSGEQAPLPEGVSARHTLRIKVTSTLNPNDH